MASNTWRYRLAVASPAGLPAAISSLSPCRTELALSPGSGGTPAPKDLSVSQEVPQPGNPRTKDISANKSHNKSRWVRKRRVQMVEQYFRWWCKQFHTQVFRPVRGQYRCAECLRTWPVPWNEQTRPEPRTEPTE